jgi:hypothetical protein
VSSCQEMSVASMRSGSNIHCQNVAAGSVHFVTVQEHCAPCCESKQNVPAVTHSLKGTWNSAQTHYTLRDCAGTLCTLL